VTHDEAFLDSIREEPDDDGLRLIYADFLEDRGDPRGEFIRVQVELARMAQDDPRWEEYWRRERELLEAHWDAWARPLEQAMAGRKVPAGMFWLDRVSGFRRGFVEVWTTKGRLFVDRCAEVFRLDPIRHVRLDRAGSLMEEVAGCPWLRYVEVLEFIDYYTDPVRADGAAALARSPYLGRLRELNLQRNDIGDEGLRMLCDASWLPGLVRLNLVDNGLGEDGLTALAGAHLSALTDLRLGGNRPGRGLTPLVHSHVAEQLTDLDVSGCNLSPSDLACLLESPRLCRLTHLDLGCNPLGLEGARLLAGSPLLGQLTSLFLDRCDLGDEGVGALIDSPHLAKHPALNLQRNGLSERSSRLLVEAGLWDRVLVEELDPGTGERLL
jgi:uncharacterized protein (TIGR02996 family)